MLPRPSSLYELYIQFPPFKRAASLRSVTNSAYISGISLPDTFRHPCHAHNSSSQSVDDDNMNDRSGNSKQFARSWKLINMKYWVNMCIQFVPLCDMSIPRPCIHLILLIIESSTNWHNVSMNVDYYILLRLISSNLELLDSGFVLLTLGSASKRY